MVISDRTVRRYVGYVPTMISVIMSTAPVPRAVPRDGKGQTARKVSNLLLPFITIQGVGGGGQLAADVCACFE